MRLLILFFTLAVITLLQSADGMKEVIYQVDGTAKYAALTLTTKNGGKEQNTVKLPFELTFYAKTGSFLYLSAQKTRVVRNPGEAFQEVLDNGVDGTVHVVIKAGGSVLQEASSSSPYGIATADGKVPD